ncbi:MAG: alpha-2-macroglobulin family protein [Azonexus sp.]|jgi:uncharacterized protein YfaS (alpha-2-macroglobulin family)|nr:alpha-2-macroglobulin family protein [Azonexus sp.]
MSSPASRKTLVIAALLALLAIAAAIGLYVAKSGLPEAGEAEAGPFEIADFNLRELDGSPALVLSFTHPLDAGHHYDGEIQVFAMPSPAASKAQRDDDEDGYDEEQASSDNTVPTVSTAPEDVGIEGGELVKGAWVVGENPRLLYFPHIKPQTRYVVRVAAGLPAADGARLGAEGRYAVTSAVVAPAYYFASRGMVLPARQNGGLPVVTVNVPEVDVQFLRVKAEQLPRFLDKVISGPRARVDDGDEDEGYYYDWRATNLQGAVNNWQLDGMNKLTESVFVGRFLTEQQADKRNVTFLPVEEIEALKEPGIYIAVMSQPNRFRYEYQVTYFYVSDLGLSARLFEKSADAYVSALTSGKAVAGVEVSWLDANGKVLARAETDGNGRAAFAEKPAAAKVIMARQGKQVSMIALKEPALDLSEYDITGQSGQAVRLFPYAGRDLYRPGENFELSVLARDADGQPIPAQPIQAILKRPDGKNQFTATWQPAAKETGFYRQKLELPLDAPTGRWSLQLRADPGSKLATASFGFNVEEFLPERMKLDLASEQASVMANQTLVIAVKGSYLYGAPAAGNELLGIATFLPEKNPLKKQLPGFEFGDANEQGQIERIELPKKTLDENGQLSLDVDLAPAAGKDSPYRLVTSLSLLESGGRPVIRNFERIIWPAPELVGLRPLFTGDYAREGSLVQFEVVRANAAGELSAASGLPVRLFRENRSYYWRFDDQRGWNSGFTETDELVNTTTVSIPAGGRGKLAVPVKYGRYRLEIFDPTTRQTLKYRFYAGWSAKSEEGQGIRPDKVALKFDKPAYREGETAKLTITPPHAGEALITVESDHALWVKRALLPLDGATIEIPVDKDWKRHDLYVSVAVLRPGSSGEKVTPARALGVAFLPLDRSERQLTVNLDAPKRMRPEAPLKVKVKAPGLAGQAAFVTLSAVDVGILNITNFKTPDPFAGFFGKLRYGADQYDVYGRLIEKMPGKKGKLKFGGDATPAESQNRPQKVRLIDLFAGPVTLDAQGEAEVSLNVPDFNGTLRLMAVVAGTDRFGSAEAETLVAAPLVAELLTPRFLAIGDKATVALDLHNLSGAAQKYKVRLENRDGLKIDQAERQVELKDQQKQTLRFPLETGTAFGLADVRVVIGGADGYQLERSFGLEVEAATPHKSVLRMLSVAPGETAEIKDGELSGLLHGTVEAHLTLSNQAPIDIRSAIRGLLVYPYGCAEQTISSTYPHVFVDDEAAKTFGLKPFSREERAAMIEKSIAKLSAMQAPNGGLSLWGGNLSEYQYWLSAYLGNFLLDANEQGFGVPSAMQEKTQEFLLKYLQEGVAGLPQGPVFYNENGWQDYRYGGAGRFGVLAYGAYVLAREAKAPLSTLRQMFEVREQAYSGLSLIQLGLALKLMGDDTRAQTALAEGVKKARMNGYWWGDYGSPLRDAALSYVLLARHKVKVEGQDNLIAIAASEMGKGSIYTSTQEKLALFLLGRAYGTTDGSSGAGWQAELLADGKTQPLQGNGVLIQPLAADALKKGLRLHNTHDAPLYAQIGISGNTADMPAERSDLIKLSRDLFDANGQPLKDRVLKVGESIIVRLTIDSSRYIPNGMVVDRIPAGLEIENLNIAQGEGLGSVAIDGVNPAEAMADSRRIQHVEFRDDRFVVAARLGLNYYTSKPFQVFYRARVVTPGRFVIPPVYAEDMYRPDNYGLAAGGGTLVVTDGKETPAAPPSTPDAAAKPE